MRKTLQLKCVTSLREAIERAKAVKLIQESSFEGKSEGKFYHFGEDKNRFGETEGIFREGVGAEKRSQGRRSDGEKFVRKDRVGNDEKAGNVSHKEC